MVLKDLLQKHNIPLPADFDERMDLLIAALRRSSKYSEKLRAFKSKRGGAEGDAAKGEDWLGPKLTGFIDLITSPAARGVLMSVFAVVFFIKYLESLPVFGRILSAALDLMIMGGKMLTKSVQKTLPPAIGLIPLPYASTAGLAIAALFGMIMWPLIGLVSLSRADFTAAIESFIRAIPPPMGDTIADLFLEGNRAVARIDEKRVKLVEDLTEAFNMLSEVASNVSAQLQEGVQSLSESVKSAAASVPQMPKMPSVPQMPAVPKMPSVPQMPAVPKMPSVPQMPAVPKLPSVPQMPSVPKMPSVPQMPTLPKGGRHRFSRRVRRSKKWRTLRSNFGRR